MITGAIAAVLLLSVGFAVNLAQLYNVKSNLGHALDAAVTSTARDLTTGKVEPEDARALVEIFLQANSDPELVASDRLVLDRLVVDQAARTVEATAHVDVDLFFPLFRSGDTQRVDNISAAIYSDKQIEVAMMLDVTGSMEAKGKKDKIGDLIDAAKNAVTTMLANQDPKNPRIRVALVPYASGVNTGALLDNVYAEQSGRSDLPPAADDPIFGGKKDKPLPAFGDYVSAVKSAFPHDDNCATERKDKDGNPDFSADGPDTVRINKKGKKYYALVNRDNNLSGEGMNRCPDAKVIPLTANSDTLINSIKNYKANGYTAGAIAVQWTYYMLSPKWRDAIKTAKLGDGPSDHDSRRISKVAILMTDGQFNTAYAGVNDKFNAPGFEGASERRKDLHEHERRGHRGLYDRLRSGQQGHEQRRARSGEGRAQEMRDSGHLNGAALLRDLDWRRARCGVSGNHRQHRKSRADPIVLFTKGKGRRF